MRAKEFVMKDAYSFDATDEGAQVSYRKMYDAYARIFQRCGLKTIAVEADTGVMGGKFSHEFMVSTPETVENEVFFLRGLRLRVNARGATSVVAIRPWPKAPGAATESILRLGFSRLQALASPPLNFPGHRQIQDPPSNLADSKPRACLLRRG